MTDSRRRRIDPLDIRPEPAGPRFVPPAPGAVRSPQIPGQVPDRSVVPGQGRLPVPKARQPRPPLTEFGTAQRIMRVFELAPGQEDNPARWEQATASYEEMRKADPRLLPPLRPAPGFRLAEGAPDLAMLPDSNPTAVTVMAGAPPQEGAQRVSPGDATVPNQARGATPPAPGDAVSTGGTLPAAKEGQPETPSDAGKGPTIAPQ